MAKIVLRCPTCHKVAEVKSELKMAGAVTIKNYVCGHVEVVTGVSESVDDTLNVTSIDGKRPFPYQLEGGRFAEASDVRCLFADEMGLGKTVESIIVEVAHPELRPFAVFCKSGLKIQWTKECVRWGDFVMQMLDDTKTPLLPGFDGYIISLDAAWRMKDLPEQLKKCKVKSVIVDECQLIKNDGAKRTKAIQDVCRDMKHIMALSGTPIKNNAGEYFPILNILRPDKFPNKKQFLYGWCDSYYNGYATKTGGVKNPKAFEDFTKDFIIRRLRKDVLPDLPSIWRQFSFSELGPMVEDAYRAAQKDFNDAYDASGGSMGPSEGDSLLGYMAKMRHLTGLAKIDPVCDYVEEFITATDRKLAIFVHHEDVAATLKFKLEKMAAEWPAEWGPKVLSVYGIKAEDRQAIIDEWKDTASRICIFSTLASGEGLNLQFCSDCIMMERQWNPANEEQAEARFPRPGQTADKINATYFTAVGTIDEFLAELVEQKREICTKTMDHEAVAWNQTSLLKELAVILREKGGYKWGW